MSLLTIRFNNRLAVVLIKMQLRICFIFLFFSLIQCNDRSEKLFNSVGSEITGIRFSNTITYSDSLSVLDFEYMYNGGGVAVGDINNDGLQDIYFTGNMTSSTLYLNKGNLKFEDITDQAMVGTTKWANGVAMVDINQDGFKDIYVCVGGNRNTPEKHRLNLLFINNGDATFTESAVSYGLADSGYGIQSAFFDYDGDGDLDMYLLRNSFVSYHRNASRRKLVNGEAESTDKLFRNNGDNTFTDVSRKAGILIEGFGLGVEVCDINDDGWPDVYVSNDFITNDLVWINNQDGTFTNQAARYLKHQTFNGMGVDVADYNNDGKVDIVVLDMLPEDNKRWKLTPRGNSYDEFQKGINNGYEPQYIRNTLQLNNGNGTFSEIGQLAGIEATEWSWSALFADYDHDGSKDLFITNGYGKDVTNLDFIVYGDKTQSMGLDSVSDKERQALLNELPGIKIHNYMYKNKGDLTFSDESESWGMSDPTYSNGAAYADLDNDGDLDLVINNIDDEASILECRLSQMKKDTPVNYLRIGFSGPLLNREGFGAKVYIKHKGSLQYQYFTPFRGYLSSVEPYFHFGLGAVDQVDSVEVIWPDGKYQLIKDVSANQVLKVQYSSATARPIPAVKFRNPKLFEEVTETYGINYLHRENIFVDFKVQPILPHMHSRNGPGVAVGDVNGDGMEDFYVGGSAGFSGALFIQRRNGKFDEKPTHGLDSLTDSMGVLFFDADNDTDLDLYIASGGTEHKKGSELYQDHLYLNDGEAEFSESTQALPLMPVSGSCVIAGDYDKDGDLDLFVGGRVSPGEYPMPVSSYLLRNDSKDGSPLFTNVNQEDARALENIGMVCLALWSDYDNDGWIDLILSGEFMELRFIHNENGKLVEATDETGLKNTSGWWNSLVGGDFDGDGDTDYVAGNLGMNNHFRSTPAEPLCIYANDYNKDGRIDPVMTYYVQGEKYVGHSRDHLIDQINSMRARFRTYTAYADATFKESFLPEELKDAHVVCADRFESSYIENLGNGRFTITTLPLQAQISPMYGMVAGDYDEDGNLDILAVGNSYAPEVISGRDDASIGWYLRGDGKGNFTCSKNSDTGFICDNDAKGMASVVLEDGKELIIVGNNSGPLRSYLSTKKGRYYRAEKDDAYALITRANGSVYKHEFYFGSTYLSSSSRSIKLMPDVRSIKLFNTRGNVTEIDLGLLEN
ncbi:MAG: VCBS repeat-containing protein [Cyclobacteriaceae bacterium]